MKEVAKYSGCFVCGGNNDIGLKARFFYDDEKAVTEYTAEKRFEGYYDILHGGITSALLDEVMIKALLARDIYAMTVEMTVRFHKAVFIGQRLSFEGYVTEEKGRLYVTEGRVLNQDREIVATATGKYLSVKKEMKEKLRQSLDV